MEEEKTMIENENQNKDQEFQTEDAVNENVQQNSNYAIFKYLIGGYLGLFMISLFFSDTYSFSDFCIDYYNKYHVEINAYAMPEKGYFPLPHDEFYITTRDAYSGVKEKKTIGTVYFGGLIKNFTRQDL